jgi:hypothetical protein
MSDERIIDPIPGWAGLFEGVAMGDYYKALGDGETDCLLVCKNWTHRDAEGGPYVLVRSCGLTKDRSRIDEDSGFNIAATRTELLAMAGLLTKAAMEMSDD